MATRTFRIFLNNQTPFALKQVQLAVDHGDWTDPWQPHDTIDPGQTVGWQTESSGDVPVFGSIATGTQGSITYEIEDGDALVSVSGQTNQGQKDHLYIFWDTPFEGLTTTDIHWRVMTDIPAAGGSFATQDYRDGASHTYQVLSSLHAEEGDEPGPLSTTGWLEVVPGVFALPIPDPALPHAQVDIYLQVKKGVSISGTQQAPAFNPPSLTTLSSCSHGPQNAFQGAWGDSGNQQNARILVAIEGNTGSTSSSSRAVVGHLPDEGKLRNQMLGNVHQPMNPASPIATRAQEVSHISAEVLLQDGLILSKDAGGTWGLVHLPEQYHPLLKQSLALYRGEPLGHVAGRALLEAFAEALMNKLTKASRLTGSETRRLQDEEAVFDAQSLERWFDDGAIV